MKMFAYYVLFGLVSIATFAQATTTLTVSFSDSLPAINPIYAVTTEEAQFFTAIHEGLVQYDPEYLFPVPAIAESWTTNKRNTRYTFTLRENAYFSNGEQITAQDFVDSWKAQLDAGKGSYFAAFFDIIAGAYAYRDGNPKRLGLRALDEKTLQVDLVRATPQFLKMLCHHSFTVTHSDLRKQEKNPTDLTDIPYSGPYYIADTTEDTFTLTKNEYYWNYEDVYFATIRAGFDKLNPDEMTDLYNRGLVDWIVSGNVTIEELEHKQNVVVDETFSSTFLFFRTLDTWGNPEIRRALALLVNWELIRSREHFLAPSANLIPAIPNYTPGNPINLQDREQALEILAKHGYSSSNPLPPLRVALPSPSWIEYLETPFTQAWSDIVEELILFHLPQSANLVSYYATSDMYDIGMLSWIADYTDPYALLELFVEESAINFSQFQDDAFTDLINKSFSESDRTKRYSILTQAEEILLQTAVVMPMRRSIAINVLDNDRYTGWYSNPLDIHPFAAMKLNPNALPQGITNHSLPDTLLVHRDIDSRYR